MISKEKNTVQQTNLPLYWKYSKSQDLFDLCHGVIRTSDSVTNSPAVTEYLKVIATLHGLVSEEMYLIIAILFHKLETVGLVPALGENVYRYLATHGKLKT